MTGAAAWRTGGLIAALAWLWLAAAALAQPSFPALTGRVVDEAGLLTPAQERELEGRLAALESRTTDQLVVVTVRSLQGYEIEEYGYQLGRAWGIGQSAVDNGVLLIVAPNERQVRIEVGYGLEPVLTDAMSSLIIQRRILPAFHEGDYAGGIAAGAEAIIEQLTLDPEEAQARARAAAEALRQGEPGVLGSIAFILALLMLYAVLGAFGGRRGRRRRLGDAALPVILWDLSRGGGGGGGWGGGGGFGGGGGSFGGGGASGRW